MSGRMLKHPNAIGYLDELTAEIEQPWFSFLRDAAVNNISFLEPEMLEKICETLIGKRGEFQSITFLAPEAKSSPSISTSDYLEQLSRFSNFKLLSNSLTVNFNKQVSIIFGANGSGKSSLCESLKVLANPDAPKRPIINLRTPSDEIPSFSYKLKSNATATVWTTDVGYGIHSDKIKFFDSTIASHNVSVAVEPGRVISITPFRLGVFESIRNLTIQVRDTLLKKQRANSGLLTQALAQLNDEFQEFDSSPLKSITIETRDLLFEEIERAKSFNQQEDLTRLKEKSRDLEKAISDEGIKALKLELRELDVITSELKTIIDNVKAIWNIDPVEKVKRLETKKAKQHTLSEALIPEGSTLDQLMALVKSSSAMCKLEHADGQVCPLCRRTLEEKQIGLFKQYHDLVTGQLEVEIRALEIEIEKANELIKEIHSIDITSWDNLSTLSAEKVDIIKTNIKMVINACELGAEISEETKNSLSAAFEYYSAFIELLESKQKAIDASKDGRDAILHSLKTLQDEIMPLAYLDYLTKKIDKLQNAQQVSTEAKDIENALSGFTPLLTKITNASKTAYENLVVCDFEERLNQEYLNLTEKNMSSFGVTLKRSGTDASVTVKPQVGGKRIGEVLSEGERRMHSLALFFAELECSCCSIIVFDDPISSFDYNYIENFCIRLRDFILTHFKCQIIVLTHNWDFFVQLQAKLNSGGLNGKISVQVLENCCAIDEYSEKADELKRDISYILSLTDEPNISQKEQLAGKMRRLIETVVNKHVFSGQRHQYKQKSQAVSEFKDYTKVTPLTQAEALELSDLYSKLSVSEHDDPRNAYINTDKATFQARYDRIISIEQAIVSRKPLCPA